MLNPTKNTTNMVICKQNTGLCLKRDIMIFHYYLINLPLKNSFLFHYLTHMQCNSFKMKFFESTYHDPKYVLFTELIINLKRRIFHKNFIILGNKFIFTRKQIMHLKQKQHKIMLRKTFLHFHFLMELYYPQSTHIIVFFESFFQ